MEQDIYQKIEAYLGGEMTPGEQREFELAMSQDLELQKEVRLSNEINHHLNEKSWLYSEEAKDDKTKQELEEYIKSEEAILLKSKISEVGDRFKKRKHQRRRFFYTGGAIAAIFILGFFVTNLFFDQKSNAALYNEYYTDMDLPSLVKRGSQNKLLQDGIVAFKAKEYKEAITAFQKYMDTSKDENPLIHAYIGFSHLETNQIEKSLNSFDTLLRSDSIDRSRGLWYKALAYLKDNRIEASKKVLSKIIGDSLNYNYKKAKELLDDFD